MEKNFKIKHGMNINDIEILTPTGSLTLPDGQIAKIGTNLMYHEGNLTKEVIEALGIGADKLTSAVDLSLTGDVLGTVTTDLSGNVELVVTNIKPQPPTNLSFNIVDEDIELIFTKSVTDSDKYEIFGSSDNIHFNVVKVVNSDDITDTIVVLDDTFENIGNQYYKIYAVKSGVYSDALIGTFNFPDPNLDVTDLQINPSLEGFIVQWDNPDSKFYKAVNVYVDKNSVSSSLNRSNATLLYQGDATNYVYNVPNADIDLFHQFWVEVV